MKPFTWFTITTVAICSLLAWIVSWFKLVKQGYSDNPWNEYSSEEDTNRELYKIQLKEELVWLDTVRREAQQSDTE